jgi:hypothetical protein
MECADVLSASLIRHHFRRSQEFSISLEKKNIFAASIEFSFLSLRTRFITQAEIQEQAPLCIRTTGWVLVLQEAPRRHDGCRSIHRDTVRQVACDIWVLGTNLLKQAILLRVRSKHTS